jgi:hypothetical protein
VSSIEPDGGGGEMDGGEEIVVSAIADWFIILAD